MLREALAVFAPEVIAQRGAPARIKAVHQEVPLPDLGDPSRFLDVALLCTWADGTRRILLLIEHWSEVRKISLDRVHWLYSALRLKHPDVGILPTIIVNDDSSEPVPDLLEDNVDGIPVLAFRVRTLRVDGQSLPRLRALQLHNRVAAMLTALARGADAVFIARDAFLAFWRAPGELDDVRRFLPLAAKLAKLRDADEPRFRRALREEPTKGNLLDDMKAEGKAEASRAMIASIRRLVAAGKLPVDGARAEILDLIANGVVPEATGQDALKQLG